MSLAALPTYSRRGSDPRRIVPPEFRVSDGPAASVFRVARLDGPVTRDFVSRTTNLSMATVNRQVAGLFAADLLKERADLVEPGAVGRPRVPFEINHEPYSTVGIHIGANVTSIVVSDLRGRILGAAELRTPKGAAQESVSSIGRSAHSFAARWRRRTPLWVGIALGGRVDTSTGIVDHPRLGWKSARVGAVIGREMGLPVSVSGHVEAMAGAELHLAPPRTEAPFTGTSLYFYARETVGSALTIDGKVHVPSAGPGSIAHLPTGSFVEHERECDCGRTGCLEATVSDRAVLGLAVERGVVGSTDDVSALYESAHAGSVRAQEILNERARVLGTTLGHLRDLLNPERVIVGGQAFTGYEAGLPLIADAFGRASTFSGVNLRVSRFGNRVQQYAAAVVSLSCLYADPLASTTRA